MHMEFLWKYVLLIILHLTWRIHKDPWCILLCLKIATAFQRQLQKTALYNELYLRYGVLIGVRSWDKHLSEQERENKVQQQTQCHRVSQRLLISPLFFFPAGAVTYPWTFFQTNWEIAVSCWLQESSLDKHRVSSFTCSRLLLQLFSLLQSLIFLLTLTNGSASSVSVSTTVFPSKNLFR